MHCLSYSHESRRKRGSKYFIHDNKSKNLTGDEFGVEQKKLKSIIKPDGQQRMINLVKQKSSTKSPMFMTSSSSIYAAACKHNSLLDGLHGSSDYANMHGRKHARSSGDEFSSAEIEKSLIIIHIHFGGCSIFQQQFDLMMSSAGTNSISPCIIEHALHRSVRHLCDRECFRRAYFPIRELTFFWRDVTIADSNDGSLGSSSPSRRRRLTKEKLFSGWGCKVLPIALDSNVTPHTTKQGKLDAIKIKREKSASSSPIIFISPDGCQIKTKTKAISYMNESFSSFQLQGDPATSVQQSTPSVFRTPLIDATTKINPLYSPFGLLEELFLCDPWKLLDSTICLNVTTRAQVDRILHHFLQRWPDAESTARANWQEISHVITPLGLGNKRAKGLIRFSKEYLSLVEDCDAFSLTEKQVKGLYNVGGYSWTAYEVFILKQLPLGSVKVSDHALQLYVEYQLGCQASASQEN